MPDLTVIVVTHENTDLIGRCLAAIRAGSRCHELEVIVVDNASADGTAEVARRAEPQVRVLALEHNNGFARANNEGLKLATTDVVALINSDCFPDPGALDVLVAALEANPDVGLVTGRLRYEDGRHQPSAGQLPTLASELWLALGLHRAPLAERLGVGVLYSERLYDRPRRVGWVSGAFCIARREIGPLPTSAFMYGEDVEWADGARQKGWAALMDPSATAVHVGGASVSRTQSPRFVEERRVDFLLRWFARGHPLRLPAIRAIVALYGVTRLAGVAIRPVRSQTRLQEFRRAVAILRLALRNPPRHRVDTEAQPGLVPTLEPSDSVRVARCARTVVIDALAARYGGAAYATLHMASELADDPEIAEVVLIARRGSLVAGGNDPQPGLRLVTLRSAGRLELARRVAWEALRLPGLLREASPAVLVTWSGMLPRRPRSPVICYLANPLVFANGGLANKLRRWAVRRTARVAAHILVPTAGMGELVTEHVGRRPEIVPLGVDHTAFQPASGPGDEILCVADPYRHKRHEVLLAAWAALPAPRPRLRLIGDLRVDAAYASELMRLIEHHRGDGEIVLQTGLPHDELLRAYHAARVFLLTSEHESFCLPLLEAQACGVPAVVRDMPSLRESSGGAAVFVSGDDPATWSAALSRLLTDDPAHAAARADGLAHARRSGWERTAAGIRDRALA